ncbi:unnamed protein product [Medioppia subpectinata]|uniref:Uncharacterized protein n=1 Tax=Medioppia subpectinata TaxID=1979941 RepID=A0A7R9L6U4_9ACAR|nr:unnamed protein product [Medioppia subpectinata]CAG2116500.1 unnamed protein product [Medioppia subpectinata]
MVIMGLWYELAIFPNVPGQISKCNKVHLSTTPEDEWAFTFTATSLRGGGQAKLGLSGLPMNKAAIPIRMQIELSNPRFEIFGTVLDTDYKTYYLAHIPLWSCTKHKCPIAKYNGPHKGPC